MGLVTALKNYECVVNDEKIILIHNEILSKEAKLIMHPLLSKTGKIYNKLKLLF